MVEAKDKEGESEPLLLAFQGPVADLLDAQLGATVTDQKVSEVQKSVRGERRGEREGRRRGGRRGRGEREGRGKCKEI